MWVSKRQWQLIIMHIVLAFFVGSRQLTSLRVDASEPGNTEVEGVTAENCWLQYPQLVRPNKETKRFRDLYTPCVKPAAWSTIDHASMNDSDAGSSSDAARPVLLQKWVHNDGYIYIRFRLKGVMALLQTPKGRKWTLHNKSWTRMVG